MKIKKVGTANKERFYVVYCDSKDNSGKRVRKVRIFTTLRDAVKFAQTLRPTSIERGTITFNQNKWCQEEVTQFLNAIQKDNNGLIYELVLYTDLRINELCALSWSDIDLSTGKIKINNTIFYLTDGKYYIYPLRNRRVVKIPNEVTKKLAIYKEQQKLQMQQAGEYDHNELVLVFTNKRGNAMTPTFINHYFEKLVNKANVKMITFQDLRKITPE